MPLNTSAIFEFRSTGGVVAYSEPRSGINTQNNETKQVELKKKKMVVLGTGWAGISFMKDLHPSFYDVKVVSPQNYFAFTPLLPSVTCGTVEARSIVEPLRNIMKKRTGEFEFCEAECTKIDAVNKKIFCQSSYANSSVTNQEFALEYDYLVIAVGAQVNTFNTQGVLEHCHFLKEVEDAQKIRRTVIDCFEQAVLPDLSEDKRRRSVHFVIVGGGPTGVEFAAELHDYVEEDLRKLYPAVQDLVKITVIQSGDHILNTFDERISEFAEKKFSRDGIEVQTGCRVVGVSDDSITMNVKLTGEMYSVPYGMVVWSTGVGPRPVIRDFMEQIGQDDIAGIFEAADKDQSGILTVKEFQDVMEDIIVSYPQVDLYLKSHHMKDVKDLWKDSEGNERDEVDIEQFKLALCHVDSQMKSLPATAQVATQQGTYLAKCFNRVQECKASPEGPRHFSGIGRHKFLPFRDLHTLRGRMAIGQDIDEGYEKGNTSSQHVSSQPFTLNNAIPAKQGERERKSQHIPSILATSVAFLPEYVSPQRLRYRHFGQFAPLGGEQAAAELPGDWVSMGHSTQWLWYSVYASKQVSWRTRLLVVADWIGRFIYGRDSSGI